MHCWRGIDFTGPIFNDVIVMPGNKRWYLQPEGNGRITLYRDGAKTFYMKNGRKLLTGPIQYLVDGAERSIARTYDFQDHAIEV